MKGQSREICRDRKLTSGCQGLGGGVSGEGLWGDKNILELERVMVIQLCEYTGYHWVV